VDAGQESIGRERARTAAVMRTTAEQLRLTARILYSSAAAAPSEETATRLRVLGDAVSVQADDIGKRADRLAQDTAGVQPSCPTGRARREQGRPVE
jgi:hypothetical protein